MVLDVTPMVVTVERFGWVCHASVISGKLYIWAGLKCPPRQQQSTIRTLKRRNSGYKEDTIDKLMRLPISEVPFWWLQLDFTFIGINLSSSKKTVPEAWPSVQGMHTAVEKATPTMQLWAFGLLQYFMTTDICYERVTQDAWTCYILNWIQGMVWVYV